MTFSAKISNTDGIAILRLGGHLKLSGIDDMHAAVLDVRKQSQNRVVIDLSEVDYMDKAYTNSFFAARMSAREAQGNIVFAAVKPRHETMLQDTPYSPCEIYADVAEAIAALRSKSLAVIPPAKTLAASVHE
jgi:anti-anti-sigma factor